MWIAIGIIVVLAIALYVYLAVTCFFTEITFMTAYQTEYGHRVLTLMDYTRD